MMEKTPVLIYEGFKKPLKKGIHHRLLCISGPTRGKSFFLQGERLIIGRSKDAQISIMDPKMSRDHAEFKKIGNVYFLSDLGSINGVYVNEKKIKQRKLMDGDRVVLGTSIFKYSLLDVTPTSEINETDISDSNLSIDETHSEQDKSKNKRKIYIYLLAFLLVFFLLDEEEDVKQATKKGETKLKTIDEFAKLIEKKKKVESKKIKKKLDIIFHRGLREAREGNYFRAITEFKLALVIDPQNSRASFYLGKINKELDQYIQEMFVNAENAKTSLKYREAASIYCSILRFLKESNEKEKEIEEAEEKLHEVEKMMGKEKGEINCS